MTRFIHDQFAKDYLEELLKPYGEVQGSSRVAGEVREIDVLFSPLAKQSTKLETLGLLGRFAATAAIFEPFRNAASKEEICDCLLKSLEVRGALQRQANRNKTSIQELELPKLWILTPTASTTLLSGFGASQKVDWLPGVHFIAEYLRTAIVAIHQLPRTQETLWLRILGRGTVQKQAIDELEALPSNHPFRKATLELLYNLQQNLRVNQNSEEDDRELIMRLKPFYQQDREQAVQEGEQRLIIRLLNRRLGEIDSSNIERVQGLSIEQLEALGETLLDFSAISDLEAWLNQQINQNPEKDNRELIMQLKQLDQQDREEAIQQGEQRLIIRQLNRRFGEINSSNIERVQGLSIELLERLGEALLDFSAISDLEAWLNQQIE